MSTLRMWMDSLRIRVSEGNDDENVDSLGVSGKEEEIMCSREGLLLPNEMNEK